MNKYFGMQLPNDIEGLHFHTLCEQDADDLVSTFEAFEEKFKPYLTNIKWLNLGGGHHITRDGYDIDKLVALIKRIKETYRVEVYLEPGEAIALNAGYFVTEVMDIVHNGIDILILDASAACHMPDVLEMPYRPPLRGGFAAGEKAHTYRLSSMTCLAGDVIGDYSFENEIKIKDRLVLEDMAIYSMVKNNTFNGMPLPSIALLHEDGDVEIVRKFDYDEFKRRL
jgi:carboxynorspermidine decarboxylase